MNSKSFGAGGRASLIDDRRRARRRRIVASFFILVVLVVLVIISLNYLNSTRKNEETSKDAKAPSIPTDILPPPNSHNPSLPDNPAAPVEVPPITDPVVSRLRIRIVNETGSDSSSEAMITKLKEIGYSEITVEKPWAERKRSKGLVLYRPGSEGVAEAAKKITERLKLDPPVMISTTLVLGLDFPQHKDLPIKHKDLKSEKNAFIELLNGTDQPYVSKTKLVEFLSKRRLIVAGDPRNFKTNTQKKTLLITGPGGNKAAEILREMYELDASAVQEDTADIILVLGSGN